MGRLWRTARRDRRLGGGRSMLFGRTPRELFWALNALSFAIPAVILVPLGARDELGAARARAVERTLAPIALRCTNERLRVRNRGAQARWIELARPVALTAAASSADP